MARPSDLPTIEHYAHGKRARYVCGCRCEKCRTANRLYARSRAKAIIFHGKDSIVSAQATRQHLLYLSRHEVGRRAVAAASGVSETIIQQIRSGNKKTIRASTQNAILGVTTGCLSDHAHVSAKSTWQMLDELLREGFTKTELARRLGYKTPSLQMKRTRITAKTHVRVERFYRIIMAGA